MPGIGANLTFNFRRKFNLTGERGGVWWWKFKVAGLVCIVFVDRLRCVCVWVHVCASVVFLQAFPFFLFLQTIVKTSRWRPPRRQGEQCQVCYTRTFRGFVSFCGDFIVSSYYWFYFFFCRCSRRSSWSRCMVPWRILFTKMLRLSSTRFPPPATPNMIVWLFVVDNVQVLFVLVLETTKKSSKSIECWQISFKMFP